MEFASSIRRQRRFATAPGCVALVLLLALAEPVVAHAQAGTRDHVPSELWQTYPLDPSKGKARVRAGTGASRERVDPPRPVATTSADTRARDAGGQPSAIGDGSSNTVAVAVLVLSFFALLLVLFVVRPVAVGVPDVSGALARFGAAVASPLRSVATTTVPRPRLSGRPSRRIPKPERVRRTRSRTSVLAGARRRLTAGLRVPLTRRRSFGTRKAAVQTASSAAAALRVPLGVAAALAAGLRHGAVGLISLRYRVAFYAFVALVSAAVGVGVVFLMSGA